MLLYCIQTSGDILFVPSGWSLNIDELAGNHIIAKRETTL